MKRLTTWIWLVLLMLPVGDAFAQRGPQPQDPQQRFERMQAKFSEMRSKLLREELGLDEARAKQCEAVFAQFETERRQIKKAQRDARKSLKELYRKWSDDDAAWSAAIEKLLDAQRSLHELRFKEFQALSKILTGREQARLLQHMKKMHQRMKRMKHRRHRGERGPRGDRGRRGDRGDGADDWGPPRGGPPGGGPPGDDFPF